MIKEFGIAALTALSINTADASVTECQNLFTQISSQQKPDVNYEQDFSITQEEKEYLQKIAKRNLEVLKEYKLRNEEVFKNNFDKWVTEESDTVDFLVSSILKESSSLSKAFKKEAKYYKNYSSISKQLLNNSEIWNEIYKFTFKYKVKAREAKETYAFMKNFVKENQEVLEALA